MNAENRILRLLMIIVAALVMATLFVAMAGRGKSGPQQTGGKGAVERILDAFRQKMNVRSPTMSDGDLREKARQYLR